jgi:D-alanyl-D-alanine carboxypeptidase
MKARRESGGVALLGTGGCLIAALCLSLVFSATAAEAGPRHVKAFQNSLTRVMKAPNGPPGVSVLIVRKGQRQYFSRGLGNVRGKTAPRLNQAIRIASVSKAYSGAVALALVAQGKLKLSDTIGKLLPGLLPRANRVTLAQALQHTGGLPDYIRDAGFIKKLIEKPSRYMTPRQLISFVRGDKLEFRPGSRYEYSDTDNIVVGLMAEKVTGVPYERLIRRLIGGRIKMTRTSLPRTIGMPTPFLRGYEITPRQPPEDVSRTINPALAWASGGIVSTLPDLSRFFRGYVGGRLFGSHARQAQRQWVRGSSSPPGPGVNGAGLGLFRYRTKCGTVFGHTGSFPGYRIFAASSANGKRSIAYVANAQIVPGQGSARVSALIRKSQVAAVCHALR